MQYTEIKNFVDSIHKGQLGINIVAVTSCDKKFLAVGKKYIGRVKKVALITNARLGVKYESKVEAKGNGEFNVQRMNGFEWVEFPFFKRAIKSGETYLNINYRNCDKLTTFDTFYLLDGHEASEIEKQEIEACMKKTNSYSKKQAEYGITDEDCQTKVVSYKIDGIMYVGCNKAESISVFESLKK